MNHYCNNYYHITMYTHTMNTHKIWTLGGCKGIRASLEPLVLVTLRSSSSSSRLTTESGRRTVYSLYWCCHRIKMKNPRWDNKNNQDLWRKPKEWQQWVVGSSQTEI